MRSAITNYINFSLAFASFFVCCDTGLAQDGKKRAAQDRDAIIAELELSKEQAEAIEFAPDQKSPIFVYGASGGMGVSPNPNGKMGVAAKVKIFADGRVIVSGRPGTPDLEEKLSEVELAKFLNFVVNTNGFYQLNSKEISKTISGKQAVKILDAPSTVVIVELKKGRHDVSVYALWNAVKNFPKYDPVKRVKAIEDQCTKIMTRVHLGDRGDEVLKFVNEKVAGLNLGLDPFSMPEMRLATRMPNGRFQVRFTRELPGAKAKRIPPSTMHAIYFKKDKDTEPVVNFYGLPKKQNP